MIRKASLSDISSIVAITLVLAAAVQARGQSPSITSVTPAEAQSGETVHLVGSGFDSLFTRDPLGGRYFTRGHCVRFAGPSSPLATVMYVSDRVMDVVVPSGAVVGPIGIRLELDYFDQRSFRWIRTRRTLAESPTFRPMVLLHIDNQAQYLINRMQAVPSAGPTRDLLPPMGYIGNPRGTHDVPLDAQAYTVLFDIGTLPPHGMPISYFNGMRVISLVSGPPITFSVAALQPDWLMAGQWTATVIDGNNVQHQLRLECSGYSYTLYDQAGMAPEWIRERGVIWPLLWGDYARSVGYRFGFTAGAVSVHGPQSMPAGRWDVFMAPISSMPGMPSAQFRRQSGVPRLQ